MFSKTIVALSLLFATASAGSYVHSLFFLPSLPNLTVFLVSNATLALPFAATPSKRPPPLTSRLLLLSLVLASRVSLVSWELLALLSPALVLAKPLTGKSLLWSFLSTLLAHNFSFSAQQPACCDGRTLGLVRALLCIPKGL